jgi:hypothetical protein
MIETVFGSDDHEQTWQEGNTAPDNRQRIIEWLDAVITTEVPGEVEKMNEELHTRRVQEAHGTSESVATRRYNRRSSGHNISLKQT